MKRALALLLLFGCEGVGGIASPEVPLWVHHPGSALGFVGRRELSARPRRVGEPYERGRPELDPTHRRVFVGSSDEGFYALRAADLSTLWRFETDGAVQSEPLYDAAADVVYFGSNDGALYKLRASDGALLWRFASNAEIARRPVLQTTDGEQTLFVVNANDTLIAIDPEKGKLRWYRHRPPAFGMEIAGYAGPAVHRDTVYAAFSDGVVMAYRTSDGTEAWPGGVDLTAEAEGTRAEGELRYLDVDTTPVVLPLAQGPAVVVASYEGGIYALDAATGAQVWHNDGATGATELVFWQGATRDPKVVAGRHGVLVASSGLTGVWGLSPEDGAQIWRRDLPTGGVTAAAPWAGALLVGTTRYGLFLLSPLDGGVLDGFHAGGAFAATPAAHGLRAFALSNEGILFSLSLRPPTRTGG